MRALSAVLQDLLTVGELVVARPLAGAHAQSRAAMLPALAREIVEHHGLPAEGVRTTYAGLSLAIALEAQLRAQHASGQQLASHWCAAVGVLLPIVRIEAGIALVEERERRGQ